MYKPNNPINSQTRETINIPSSGIHIGQNHPTNVKFVHNVEVKGTVTGTKPKTIEIQPNSNKFVVYSNQNDLQKGNKRLYPLNELTYTHQNRQDQNKHDYLHIDTHSGKKYSIKTDNPASIADLIQKGQLAYQINRHQFHQQPINMVPKQVNYMEPLTTNKFQKRVIPQNQVIFTQQYPLISHISDQQHQQKQDLTCYPKRKFYLNPEDWKVDRDKGLILFVNEEKRRNQKKVITWIIKKFLTTRSFMGISYPTFVMKPESILESYAKAIGAAPLLFDHVINPVQRMKKFVCLIHSFSLLFCDTTKPFNPPLGQTFQARIANGNYYAEQLCHHPPISAFLYEGRGYNISGSFEMTASIGPNSAKGSFNGDLKVEFDDGLTYIGRLPVGQFSGFLYGDQKFQTFGTYYAYNSNKLVFSATNPQRRNFFQGYIGKLKPKLEEGFFNLVNSAERFSTFPFYQRHCFDTVFSFLEMNYSNKTVFDGKEYFNTQDENSFPFLPQPIPNQKLLLKSDSRFRKDIPLRAQLKFEEAQLQKQRLEDEQRHFRKMRKKYDPIHHPHS